MEKSLQQERQKSADLAASNSRQKHMLRELNLQVEKLKVEKGDLERENKRLKQELDEWSGMLEKADPV